MTDHLIHLPQVCETEQSETVVTTPFQAFLIALQERQAQGALSSMHSAIWTAVPIERLLVDAGWTLASIVAGKLGLSFSTHKEVRLAAQLTDQMINAGLVLVHGTPAAAAEAFEAKVIGAINLALANGYRPGHTLSKAAWRALGNGQPGLARNELRGQKVQAFGALTSLWTLPSYLFLFDCYKASRDLCDDLAVRIAAFRRRNLIPTGRLSSSEMFDHLSVPYVRNDSDDSSQDQVEVAIVYLDIAGKHADYEMPAEGRARKGGLDDVLGATSAMEQLELRLSTLSAIPIDFGAVPQDILVNTKAIESNWVRGQVLCAALGLQVETLPSAMYKKAMKIVKLQSVKQLVDQTVNAILGRGTKWTVLQEDCFRQMCTREARALHQLRADPGVESSEESMTAVSIETFKITPAKALEILTDGDQAIVGTLDSMSDQKVRAFLRNKVLPKIDWSTLDEQTAMRVVNGQRLPMDLLLDGVAKLKAEVRDAVVKNLLQYRIDPEDAVVPELAKRGLLILNYELIVVYAEEIPANLMFDWLMTQSKQLERLTIVVRFRAISRLKVRQLRELCQLTAVREPLVELFSVLIRDSARADHGIDPYQVIALQLQLGCDLWREFVAAALVYDRLAELTLPADPDHPRTAWLEMAQPDHLDYEENGLAMMIAPGKQLSKLLVEYSEERAFRFLHEGSPQVERLWRDYLAH